jgi:transposase, IS30 family
MKRYKQLNLEERYHIYACLTNDKSLQEIAKDLGRSPSTISREIKRNKGFRGYRPQQSDELAKQRRALNMRRIGQKTWEFIELHLKTHWSPEQISGVLKKRYQAGDLSLSCVSHESIYRYVYKDKDKLGVLYKYLRRKKRYKKRTGAYEKRGCLPNRTPISMRPAHINHRIDVGHWEVDTIIGNQHRGAIVTLVERKSGYLLMKKIANKRANLVEQAILSLTKIWRHMVLSITSDNGKEFACHEKISQTIGIPWYFADPYASWQRGTNENTNGLVRQYFPKNRAFETISNRDVLLAMQQINQRPRKRLDFKSPQQVLL